MLGSCRPRLFFLLLFFSFFYYYLFIFYLGDPASQSTPIRWKEGNDLTKKGKDKNVGKGRKRAMEQKTFFNWFTDHGDPSADDIAEVM